MAERFSIHHLRASRAVNTENNATEFPSLSTTAGCKTVFGPFLAHQSFFSFPHRPFLQRLHGDLKKRRRGFRVFDTALQLDVQAISRTSDEFDLLIELLFLLGQRFLGGLRFLQVPLFGRPGGLRNS